MPGKTADKKYLLAVLSKLIFKVGLRLRQSGRVAGSLYINWLYTNGAHYGKSFKLKTPVSSTEALLQPLAQVLARVVLRDRVQMLAVGAANLKSPSGQLNLFKTEANCLTLALDDLNRRFGNQIIYRGSMWQTQDLAKDRIGFRKVEL